MTPQELQKELDKAKAGIYLGKEAAFLGSVLCAMEFVWDSEIDTACVSGTRISWNPEFFASLTQETRTLVIKHELGHVFRMHSMRGGKRDPMRWNVACDHVINIGYCYDGDNIPDYFLCDKSYAGMSEEQVYDLLPPCQDGTTYVMANDIKPADTNTLISIVTRAVQQAKITNGNLPGGVEELLNEFLKPVVDWRTELLTFFTELGDEDYSWSQPDRRYQDIYLPSLVQEENRLGYIAYFMDTSASVTQEMIAQFNGEVKYIKETFNPEKLDLVQFDTVIQNVTTYTEYDTFNALNIYGRGGTSLECVHEYICTHRPSVAIVFSDLECPAMLPLPYNLPVIWAVIGKNGTTPTFGKIIQIM